MRFECCQLAFGMERRSGNTQRQTWHLDTREVGSPLPGGLYEYTQHYIAKYPCIPRFLDGYGTEVGDRA